MIRIKICSKNRLYNKLHIFFSGQLEKTFMESLVRGSLAVDGWSGPDISSYQPRYIREKIISLFKSEANYR